MTLQLQIILHHLQSLERKALMLLLDKRKQFIRYVDKVIQEYRNADDWQFFVLCVFVYVANDKLEACHIDLEFFQTIFS